MNIKGINDKFELLNGVKIPSLGFGTWQSDDGDMAINSILSALECGYRHIDTAAAYLNEKSVGKAIIESKIPREEIFITSKVWNDKRGYDSTKIAFAKTCEDLQVDYLDLYLIHWPASSSRFENWDEINLDTWRAITELYKEGKIKAIGVSNFLPHHLKSLMQTEIKPMINQIEFHPGYTQDEAVQYCKDNGIIVEAWSPLGSGSLLKNIELEKIAKKHNKSIAQICIRWCLQKGVVVLPKSVTKSRILENTQVFDFEISDDDMDKINNIGEESFSGSHPDKVDF